MTAYPSGAVSSDPGDQDGTASGAQGSPAVDADDMLICQDDSASEHGAAVDVPVPADEWLPTIDRGRSHTTFESQDGSIVRVVGVKQRQLLRWTLCRQAHPGAAVLECMHGAATRYYPLEVRESDIRKLVGQHDAERLCWEPGIHWKKGEGKGFRYDDLESFLSHRSWFLGEHAGVPFSAVADALAVPIGDYMVAILAGLRAVMPELTIELLPGSLGPAETLDRIKRSLQAM